MSLTISNNPMYLTGLKKCVIQKSFLSSNFDFSDKTRKGIVDVLEETIEFSSIPVRDVMVPRSQMILINNNDSLDILLKKVVESSHSRFPVLDESKDSITGILLAKDLLKFAPGLIKDEFDSQEFELDKIIRPVKHIPESKKD